MSRPFLQPSNVILKIKIIETPKFLALLTTFTEDPLLVKLRWGICTLVCLGGIIIMFVLVGLTDNLFAPHQR